MATGARAGGKLTLETGKRLARALGISLDVIAGVYEEEADEVDTGAIPQPQRPRHAVPLDSQGVYR